MTKHCLQAKQETTSRLGEALARMVAEALFDIKASRSERPDTW